jgi:hypothetical protein
MPDSATQITRHSANTTESHPPGSAPILVV